MALKPVALAGFASVALSSALSAALAYSFVPGATSPVVAAMFVAAFWLTTLLLAFSAVVAVAGIRPKAPGQALPSGVVPLPAGRCAVLWLIAGEAPEPLAARIADFLTGLDRCGQNADCSVFVLSDTSDPTARAAEQAVFAPLDGRVHYRNRPDAVGRKPGNIHAWLQKHGMDYDTMLVLDADSGFAAQKLAAMRAQMAANPRLGLLQAGVRLRPVASGCVSFRAAAKTVHAACRTCSYAGLGPAMRWLRQLLGA